MPVKLILIDDHPLVLQGINSILEFQDDMEVVGTAVTGREGVRLLQEHQPDVALVDLRLPGEHGLDIIKKGREHAPACRFIALTSFGSDADIQRAMMEKVEGYILKEAMPEEIIAAIRIVAKGRPYVDPAIMEKVLHSQDKSPIGELTRREKEVLEALSRGMSNREIAAALFITEYTVKKHVGHVLEKLDLADRTQAALFGFARGLGDRRKQPRERR